MILLSAHRTAENDKDLKPRFFEEKLLVNQENCWLENACIRTPRAFYTNRRALRNRQVKRELSQNSLLVKRVRISVSLGEPYDTDARTAG